MDASASEAQQITEAGWVEPTETRKPRGAAPARERDALMVVLTALTGATDAIAFLRLGNVFTSVMTGNMVLLGTGIGEGRLVTLEHTATAVAAFILGTIVGARIAGRPRDDDGIWPRPITMALLAELVLFLAVAVTWWSTGSHPAGGTQTALLAASAVGLGIQSSAVLRLNVSGLSTTYLTGTLTTVVQSLTTTRSIRGNGRALCVLAALIIGAAIGAFLAVRAPELAPLVAPVILASVILVAGRRLKA
jgi:uncharacterized membrane protein YoaK (UPF0700 family)